MSKAFDIEGNEIVVGDVVYMSEAVNYASKSKRLIRGVITTINGTGKKVEVQTMSHGQMGRLYRKTAICCVKVLTEEVVEDIFEQGMAAATVAMNNILIEKGIKLT